MNTVYILSLIFSVLFLSPMPSSDQKMLVARFEIYVDPETREAFLETTFDRNCIPSDCYAFMMVMEFGNEVCSPEELAVLRERFKPKDKVFDIETQPRKF